MNPITLLAFPSNTGSLTTSILNLVLDPSATTLLALSTFIVLLLLVIPLSAPAIISFAPRVD